MYAHGGLHLRRQRLQQTHSLLLVKLSTSTSTGLARWPDSCSKHLPLRPKRIEEREGCLQIIVITSMRSAFSDIIRTGVGTESRPLDDTAALQHCSIDDRRTQQAIRTSSVAALVACPSARVAITTQAKHARRHPFSYDIIPSSTRDADAADTPQTRRRREMSSPVRLLDSTRVPGCST